MVLKTRAVATFETGKVSERKLNKIQKGIELNSKLYIASLSLYENMFRVSRSKIQWKKIALSTNLSLISFLNKEN